MVKRRALLALLPLLLLAGCKQPEKFSTSSGVSVENPDADALASAQLGELDGLLSEAELAHVHTLVEQLLPLRQAPAGPGAMPLPPSARWPTMPWSRTAASG